MKVKWGYSGRRHEEVELRELSETEYRVLGTWGHERAICLDRNGYARTVRITSVKTWVRRPHDVRIGCKYGLYEYFSVDVRDGRADWPLYVQVIDPS